LLPFGTEVDDDKLDTSGVDLFRKLRIRGNFEDDHLELLRELLLEKDFKWKMTWSVYFGGFCFEIWMIKQNFRFRFKVLFTLIWHADKQKVQIDRDLKRSQSNFRSETLDFFY
jgi:hypothetical protein